MFLLDSLLFAPLHGLLWVARRIDEAVSQEQEQEAEEIQARLRELYQRLESGQLEDHEFEAQEAELLDRLDVLTAGKEAAYEGSEDGAE